MSARQTAITIGTFDGVHVGHAALVRACREEAGPAGRVVALAFDPHPASALRPGAVPARIMPFERKAHWLRAAGADEVVALVPEPALLDRTPEEFLAWLWREHAPAVVVEGEDFRFGRGAQGTIGTLRGFAEARGSRVRTVPGVAVDLSDQTVHRATSSLARAVVKHGRMEDARRVLGRPHELVGVVVPGDRVGRTIGVPTCNLRTQCLLPGDGVYAGVAELPGGERFAAAINVGARPTFAGSERRAEVHVIVPGAHGEWRPLPGVPEYDWRLRVEVLRFVRDQVRFASVSALREQIGRDIARARRLAASCEDAPTHGGGGLPAGE